MRPDPDAPALPELQRRLRAWIAAPSGVRAALAEGGAAEERALCALLRGDARLPAVDRLEIYANAYFHRIRSALEDDLPTLRAALGADWFSDLVTAYLLVHPPRHPSLRFAGERLPAFLADDAAAAPFRSRWPWSPDLARLEWAIVDAFDAADAPALARDALAALAPERWAALRLRFQPALQMLALAWPAQRLRAAADRGEPLPALQARPAHVAVWRSEERVRHRALDPLEARALEAARAGARFGALCEQLAGELGEDEAPARAASLLARWQADGWLSATV